MHIKRMKYILIIVSLFLLIYNLRQTILSLGISSHLFIFSLILCCYDVLDVTNKTAYLRKPLMGAILIISVLLNSIFTILYSPRYYYKQAQGIIISREYKDNKNAYSIDLETKTLDTYPKLNFLIDRGYMIGVESDNNKVYYYFNPVTGEYAEIDYDNWI